jgi:hypothetical protein
MGGGGREEGRVEGEVGTEWERRPAGRGEFSVDFSKGRKNECGGQGEMIFEAAKEVGAGRRAEGGGVGGIRVPCEGAIAHMCIIAQVF